MGSTTNNEEFTVLLHKKGWDVVRRYRIGKTLANIALISPLIVFTISAIMLLEILRSNGSKGKPPKTTLEEISNRIGRVEAQIETLYTDIRNTDNVEIKALFKTVESLKFDIRSVKSLILQDPEAILTLPILKKDIEQLRESDKFIRDDINRMVDLGKWFIGALITIAIGLFSLVLTMILQYRRVAERPKANGGKKAQKRQ